MINAQLVPLDIDRGSPRLFTIQIIGANLTGADLHAQLRLYPDAPGDPLLDLPLTTSGTSPGVRLIDVDTSGTLPSSFIRLQIPAMATGSGAGQLPAAAEPGEALAISWDLFVTPAAQTTDRWFFGPVTVNGTVTKFASMPAIKNDPLPGIDAVATLTGIDLRVTISGAGLIEPLLEAADGSAGAAIAARDAAQAAKNETVAIAAQMQQKLDQLNYSGMHITSMTVTPSQAEIGSSLTVTVAWTLNRNPTFENINGGAGIFNSPTTRAFSFSNITNTTAFALLVRDDAAPGGPSSDTLTRSITFYNKCHAGTINKADGATLTSGDVNAMSESWFTDSISRTLTFTTTADGYVWYSQPASQPEPAAFKLFGFVVTPGKAIRDHVTATGQTVSYKDFLLSDIVSAGTAIVLEVIA